MRVFSIEGKFQENKRAIKLQTDFNGHIVLEKSGRIRGYIEEKEKSKSNIRGYIDGKFEETYNLASIIILTESENSPLLYCFSDSEKKDNWTVFCSISKHFLSFSKNDEYAKVTVIEETTKNPDEILDICKR